jgi:energy-converting hydrogenase Eha subunit F
MKVGLAIRFLLVNDSDVNAIVSGRVYPEMAIEGATTPYIVYSVMSNTPSNTKDGTPVDEANVEILSVGRSYSEANDLADKVRDALDRVGTTVTQTEGSIVINSIQYTNEITQVTEDRSLFASVQDYTFRINRNS